MIGGQRITDTTRAQARELLDAASSQPPPHPGRDTRDNEAPAKLAREAPAP